MHLPGNAGDVLTLGHRLYQQVSDTVTNHIHLFCGQSVRDDNDYSYQSVQSRFSVDLVVSGFLILRPIVSSALETRRQLRRFVETMSR